ncbi:hypothetical protein A9G45_00975 [Gilliamella sp. HK2]|jgi:hypothetical protein|nr:hypothetical protein A9G46_13500 [Gilliamella apicola]OCG31670.1 hypothetical protein A9G45_00975 [Gilliamella apicola]
MPFTFAHPAIILPLYKKPHLFSMTALIIGSMAPDFEYFLRMEVKNTLSHSLAGIFLFDLSMTLVMTYIFHFIVRNTLIKNLPNFFYRRFANSLIFNWNKYCCQHWGVALFNFSVYYKILLI